MSAYAPQLADGPAPARRPAVVDPTRPAARSRAFLHSAVAVAVALGAFAFLPFVLAAIHAARTHQLFLGAAGFYPHDELQYLAWVRDAHHGLIRNLYGAAGAALFVHPMWSPSGWLQALTGVSDTAIMGFWKGVGVVVLLAGCARLATRHIARDRPGRRTTALVLTLVAGVTPFTAAALLAFPHVWGSLSAAATQLIPAAALWDWAPLAIALGLMPFAVEGIERLLAGADERWSVLRPAGLGLLIAWLHPWQGEALIFIALGLGVWHWRDSREVRRWAGLVTVAIATGLPLVYYLLLSRLDHGWAVASSTDVGLERIPLPVLAAGIAPIVALVAMMARRASADPSLRPLIVWPLATAFTVAVTSSGQYRAIDGISIPVVVLAVKLWPAWRGGRRLAAWAALASLLVPTGVFFAGTLSGLRDPATRQFESLRRSDVRAATAAGRAAGDRPVLTTPVLGTAIPALTDTASWVGHLVWTPNYFYRTEQSYLLLAGGMSTAEARRFVRSVGTNAIVQPCGLHAPLERTLEGLGFRETRFGCATVYSRP